MFAAEARVAPFPVMPSRSGEAANLDLYHLYFTIISLRAE